MRRRPVAVRFAERVGREGRVSVLIIGEPGTGKAITARAHPSNVSARAPTDARVDCRRRSATAMRQRAVRVRIRNVCDRCEREGWVARSIPRRSIWLDEVAALPSPTQERLLQVSRKGRWFASGGTNRGRSMFASFRPAAATSRRKSPKDAFVPTSSHALAK